jgi:hypothetical protein
MTRAEHLAWAKQRALEYVDKGEASNAIASMLSDLGKHPETERSVMMGTMLAITLERPNNHPDAVRRWIDGFN